MEHILERFRAGFAFLILGMLFSFDSYADLNTLTYQGRIMTSAGVALEHSAVSFQFEIVNPTGSCILYREQVNGLDMTNSKGIFDVKIGASHSYPADPTKDLIDIFSNQASLTCDGGVVYTPLSQDGRLLRVKFYDGTAWRSITPDAVIRAVPYSMFAEAANKIGTHPATDFILKTAVNGNASCGSGNFLTWDAGTQTFGCAADAGGGGGGSGTVTNVSSANAYLSVSNATTTPALTVNVGTVANTVAAGNDSRFTDARTPTGTAGGDLSGTYPNPTVAKIQGRAVDVTAPSDGQVLLWDNGNTTWKAQYVRMQDVRNAWGGTQMIPSSACAANQSMTWSVVTDRFTCQSIGSLNASTITAGTIATARLGSGTADSTTYLRGDGTWAAPSVTESDPKVGANTTNYLSKWNGSALVASGVFENSGNVGIGTSTPSNALHVRANASDGSTARFQNIAADGYSSNAFADAGGTARASIGFANSSVADIGARDRMYLWLNSADFIMYNGTGAGVNPLFFVEYDNNNVGIGTTTPNYRLEANGYVGSRASDPRFISYDSSNTRASANMTGGLEIRDSANALAGYMIFDTGDSNADMYLGVNTSAGNGGLRVQTGGSDRMYVDYLGNVGIGNTSPGDKLHVSGKVRATHICAADGTNCKDLTTSWGAGGTVTSIIAGTGLDGGTITTTGTISIAAGGVSATQLASDAVTTVKILDGNVTGAKLETIAGLTAAAYGSATAIPAITVDNKGRITAISTNAITGLPAASGASGKYLKSDGTNWAGVDVKFSDIKNGVGASAFNTGSCAANQTVKWSSLTDMFECQDIGSLNASTITAGTIDAARLPANTTRWQDGAGGIIYYSGGNVGIGTSTATSALVVNGAARNLAAVSNATGTVDFATGNIQYTTSNCGAFALHNVKDGGSYTFVVQGTTAATCSFTAYSDAGTTALTVHLPAGHGATTAGEHTIYSMIVAGTHLYLAWVTEFD